MRSQAVIAPLESRRVKPSTRTLERLAAETDMRLRITFAGASEVMSIPTFRQRSGILLSYPRGRPD
jgi:hypothetical protein